MNVMKTSLTIFRCVLGSAFPIIRVVQACPLIQKGLGHLAALYYFCYLLLVTIYLITKLSVTTYFSTCREYLAENPYHFLLLFVGFDTLTYHKDYDRSPIIVGHQDSFLASLSGSEAPLVGGIW